MSRRRGNGNGLEAWPGYVDALSTLLMVTIFVLLVFVLAEAILSTALNGSNSTIDKLKQQIAELTQNLALETDKTATLSQELAALNAQLAQARAANASLTQQLAQFTGTPDMQQKLADAQKLTAQDEAQIALLNQQMAALRAQLAALQMALDAAQSADAQDKVQIAELGKQLNEALARKVEELQKYQSVFFRTLSESLKDEKNIRVVGDRFVFQSDILFPVDQATITPEGKAEIAKVAAAVKDIAKKIPPNVNWVLSVDGYADAQPIKGGPYKSNFELSTARALAVLDQLIADGVPENRLVVSGMGANNPIAPGNTPEDYAQNRRIEFRLTAP